MNEKKNLIMNYITENTCYYMCDDKLFNCESCSSLEECYMDATNKCNNEFINNVNYGGYNTKEEFWEQLMD